MTARTSSGLVKWLHGLTGRQDRGRLAALRRGLLLERHQLHELFSVVPPGLLEGIGREETERRLMVAILFATHPVSFSEEQLQTRARNLGESMHLLAKRRSAGAPANSEDPLPEPLKRRMDAILSAHPDELFDHLRHAIRLLKSEEVPVDWDELLWDLRNWDRADRKVQWKWSRSFYVGHREQEGGESHVS